jgi:hypothetical protein
MVLNQIKLGRIQRNSSTIRKHYIELQLITREQERQGVPSYEWSRCDVVSKAIEWTAENPGSFHD